MKTHSPSMTTSRRVFMMQSIVVFAAAGVALPATAQTMVAETDPQAVALGYKADAAKVDKSKQPKYAAGRMLASKNRKMTTVFSFKYSLECSNDQEIT